MGGTGFWWTWRVLGSLLLVPGILGWGKEGHYTICKIAEETTMTLLDIKIDVSLQRFTTIRCNSLRVTMSPSQHQDPLHVSSTGDEGRNTIIVRWYRRKTNLHHVWDNMIIESAVKTYYSKDLAIMIKAIERNITDGWFNVIPSWKICANNQTVCPNEHASESISLACKYAYRNATPGSTLTEIVLKLRSLSEGMGFSPTHLSLLFELDQ